MFITYLKLLKSLTSITKRILTEWPGSLCILFAASECPKWESCPPVRAREGVDISTIPKVSAGLKDDVSCPMRKHLLSAWSVGEQWVSITYTAPRKGHITPAAPLFLKTWVFPQNALMHSSFPLFLCSKSSVSIKKLFRINDAPATALCLIVGSNKAVIKYEPCSPFLFSPYPVYQSCSYKGGIISCSCIPQSRREIPLCLLSGKYKQQWWA